MSKIFNDIVDPEVATLLQDGKIGVIKTDTLYGVVAVASNEEAVEKVYAVRKRALNKPCIVLINNSNQLFDVPAKEIQKKIDAMWPDKISIILPALSAPHYLTRGTGTLAYRVPANKPLRTLLKKTGPLIAPSANLEGEPSATGIHQAQYYFKNDVDFYVDEGRVLDNTPSKIITITNTGTIKTLR